MIEIIRQSIESGNFSFTVHAVKEAAKDDLSGEDVLLAIRRGEIIEKYPERNRILVFGHARDRRPVHIVTELINHHVRIVTVYVPTGKKWISSLKKRKKQ